MTTTRVTCPRTGLTFDIENYDRPIGPPIAILAPFAKPQLVETNDYMTQLEMMELFDTAELADVMPTADGEWRKAECSSVWFFWTIPDRADDGFDEQ